jgi:hypothetical protein
MKIKSATLSLGALLAGMVSCGSQQATTPQAPTSLDDDPHRCADGDAASCQRLEQQPNYRNFQSLFILELGCQKAVITEAKQQICQQALHLATVELQDSNPDRVKGIATNGCTSGSQACCDWLEDSNHPLGEIESMPGSLTGEASLGSDDNSEVHSILTDGDIGSNMTNAEAKRWSQVLDRDNDDKQSVNDSQKSKVRRFDVEPVTNVKQKTLLRRYFQKQLPALASCIDEARKAKLRLGSSFTVACTVLPTGGVADFAFEGALPDSLRACMAGKMHSWQFPASQNDIHVKVVLDILSEVAKQQ